MRRKWEPGELIACWTWSRGTRPCSETSPVQLGSASRCCRARFAGRHPAASRETACLDVIRDAMDERV